jgi:hypothetical protein
MPHFYFSQTPPEEQLFADIQQLNPMSEAQLADLVDLMMAFLMEQSADLLADLDAFSARHSVQPTALRSVVRGLFFVSCVLLFRSPFPLLSLRDRAAAHTYSSSKRRCGRT